MDWRGLLRRHWRKPALPLTALLIAGAVVLLGTFLQVSYERDLEAGRRRTEDLALLLEEQTTRNFQAVDLVLQGVVEAVNPQLPTNDNAFREMLRRRLQALPHVRALFVIGQDGFISHDTDYPSTPRVSLADRDYFKAHKADPASGLLIGTPLKSRSVNRWFVSVSRRIDGPEQRFDGIAVAAVEPAFYDRFYRDLNLGPNDAVTLLHADGTLIARTPESFDLIGRKLLELQLFQRQLAARPHGTYVAASNSFDSQDRIVSYRRIPGLPLIITVSLSKAGVLANWYRTASAAALGATLLLVLTAIAAYLVVQRSRDRHQARQRALLTQKLEALGQMTGGIAHDFNNILAVAGAGLTLAEKHADDTAKVRSHLVRVREAVDRGLGLTRQLLAFAKRQEIEVSDENVSVLLRGIEPMLRQAAGSGVTLVLRLADDLPLCRLDRTQFEAAVLNLLINARDAMLHGGTIELEALTGPARASGIVRVRDTGPGITPENLKRVFEPFFTTKGKRGTGLGLAQVHSFMQQVGGEVRILSTVGVGTTVELIFRAARERSVRAPASDALAPSPGLA